MRDLAVATSINNLAFRFTPAMLLTAGVAMSVLLVQPESIGANEPAPTVAPQARTAVNPDNNLPAPKSEPLDARDPADVWTDISSAIISLNEVVGVKMVVDVNQIEEATMEVTLDKSYWDRVLYQTRADIKSDISRLWHLYVQEYREASSSVVYFIDHSTGRTIDIFSKAQ